MEADPKLVSDQLGHTVDVNQNLSTQSSVELRQPLVNRLEKLILCCAKQCTGWKLLQDVIGKSNTGP
jgi:hypothetical protein